MQTRAAVTIGLILTGCLSGMAAPPDSELISKALAFAKQSNEGADIQEIFFKHCRERALSFSTLPPPLGKSENFLNEVQIQRSGLNVVAFIHYGAAYDGCNCKVTVELNRKGKPIKVSTARLE